MDAESCPGSCLRWKKTGFVQVWSIPTHRATASYRDVNTPAEMCMELIKHPPSLGSQGTTPRAPSNTLPEILSLSPSPAQPPALRTRVRARTAAELPIHPIFIIAQHHSSEGHSSSRAPEGREVTSEGMAHPGTPAHPHPRSPGSDPGPFGAEHPRSQAGASGTGRSCLVAHLHFCFKMQI